MHITVIVAWRRQVMKIEAYYISCCKKLIITIHEDLPQLKLKINDIRKRIKDYWLLLKDPNGVSWSRNEKNLFEMISSARHCFANERKWFCLQNKRGDAWRWLFSININQRIIIFVFFSHPTNRLKRCRPVTIFVKCDLRPQFHLITWCSLTRWCRCL